MNTATAILFYSFIASTAILIFYYLYFFLKLGKYESDGSANKNIPLSVIICSKNDGHHLEKNLPIILTQDYPEYEVVVVNDGADESTDKILFDLQQQHPHLKMPHITDDQKTFSGKKLPLTLGIKKAQHNHLVFTDADCHPSSNNWLREIAQNFDKRFVIGFSPYEKNGGLLNKLIRFDATQVGVQYLSFAMAGVPYMGVGRNLAYTKDSFFGDGGFRSQYHIPSGDDDLFVNKFVTNDNFRLAISEDSFVTSIPDTEWRSWWRQKRRHLSTATHYQMKTKLLLGLYHSAQFIFYLTLCLLLINQIALIIVLSILLGKTIIQLLISSPAFKKLKGSDLLALSPIYEPLLLIMGVLVTFSLRFSNKIKWK